MTTTRVDGPACDVVQSSSRRDPDKLRRLHQLLDCHPDINPDIMSGKELSAAEVRELEQLKDWYNEYLEPRPYPYHT